MSQFPNKLNPSSFEEKWYKIWQSNKIYLKQNYELKPYSILMPPPNVTGILHFGHVLNHTLQDIFIRRKRMQGFDAQWFPGTDHAGIATQSRVEKELKEENNLTKYDLGKEKFIEKVWEWKEKYGGIIISQLEKLGISANWDKMIFTLDEKASNAVRDVFITLFDEGLIYKGKRIINWSPLAQTALSDEEVDWKQVKEKIYTLKYKYTDSDDFILVSTVRPETIYGDVAIAVNPKDERFLDKIGKKVIIPFVNREIPIIADDYADPEFGTGCVKITPAHDPNDFEVGNRHNLERINTINPNGTMNELAGILNGIDRFKARKKIMELLDEANLVEKVEEYTHNMGYSQRGGEPIEPYLSDQWFVNMKAFAEIAKTALNDDGIKFYPEHWSKTYIHWMDNIKDWCISRQLWWGHRIPVYYAENGSFTAARNETEAKIKLGLNKNENLRQDDDVLDTWFSSWLWPLTTQGWDSENEKNNPEDFGRYLPTDLLITGPDIIFFWVARMIMATKKFANVNPFKDVYFTSMIRDGKGRKLSKSLGNSPDPLIIIDRYGADAVRFTMIYLAPLGQDVRMDVDVKVQDIPSMEIGRNFSNKIFNAGRFLKMKKDEAGNSGDKIILENLSDSDRWILSRLNNTIKKANVAIDNYKVNEYSKLLYDFIWKDFCDWYIEIFKLQFNQNEDSNYRFALSDFAISIYNDVMKMLHPVMPFITEELWHLVNDFDENISISCSEAAEEDSSRINEDLEKRFNDFSSIIEGIRFAKANNSNNAINEKTKLDIALIINDPEIMAFATKNVKVLTFLSGSSAINIFEDKDKYNLNPFNNSFNYIFQNIEIILDISNYQIDTEAEKEKLTAEAKRLESQIIGISKKLENEKFVASAPADVVDKERKKLSDMTQSLEKINETLKNL